MLDAKVVNADHVGFVFFNVSSAVTFWNKNVRRNYGLLVKVTDSRGKVMDASGIFQSLSCSKFDV